MGACFYRLRCEVFQNLFLSPMNTGFVRPAVATVLTACGIETGAERQTHLSQNVATVLTACGIETSKDFMLITLINTTVATVLTACGIET